MNTVSLPAGLRPLFTAALGARRAIALVVLSLLAVHGWSAEAVGLRAGASLQEITPTVWPTPVNGGMRGAFATTVTDPMYARSLALSDGRHTLILCVVDSCMIPREICEEAKAIASRATGVPAAHMLISATHSHSCATMTGVFQSEPDPQYTRTLPERIAASLIRAQANLEPAEVAWGADADPTQVFNRRWFVKDGESYENPFDSFADRAWMNPGVANPKVTGPAGPVDPEVALIAARALADGRPIAVLANYSLHYVGGISAISADYFGAFARELEQRLGGTDTRYAGKPPLVAMLSNGTSGNINNVNYAAESPPLRRAPGEQVKRVAASVADAAWRAWEKLAWTREVTLASAERDLLLGVRKGGAADVERAERLVKTLPRDKDGQFSDRKAIYARETLLLQEYPNQVPVKLQAHRIGALTLAAIPCEVFVETGLALKAQRRRDLHFTVSLANGYNGYLPTAEHHALGGYETWRARSSYLEVAAEGKISRALTALLADVAP